MTSRTTRSVTTPTRSPPARSSRIRFEFDEGRSKPKMNTFESKKALLGIFGLPHVRPQLCEGDAPPRGRLDGGPEVPGPQQAEVRAVLHERGPNRLRLRREEPGPDEAVQQLRLGASELDGE